MNRMSRAELCPTCIASVRANRSGLLWRANITRVRSLGLRSSHNISRPMRSGRLASARCCFSYCWRFPAAIASASAKACRSPSRIPSPVIASTPPDASPTRATLPRCTLRRVCMEVTAPRSRLVIFLPAILCCISGNSPIARSNDAASEWAEIITMQISFGPTGVT